MALRPKKSQKLWVWKVLDRSCGRTVRWLAGDRSGTTFQKLFDQADTPKTSWFTDNWEAYREVIPPERHTTGKRHTRAIETDNSNTRHYSARFTRRTKVVSQSAHMVDLSLRLLAYFQVPEHYASYQQRFFAALPYVIS